MPPTSRLTLDFAQRMVGDLATNNVLRGSWAEQLVAHFLNLEKLPPNWSYYDMRDSAGRDISVKHSVGPQPKFAVNTSQWAWDPVLADTSPATEGWLGGKDQVSQYWCHVYVFAWLDAPVSAPPLDVVLDSDRWLFAVLSRAQMYRAFMPASSGQKSAGLTRLRQLTKFVDGPELRQSVESVSAQDEEGVPPRTMSVTYADKLGPPVETVTDVEPKAVANEPTS